MKKYIAPCTISLDLTFEDGRHRHVNFDTCTGLGSYFVTNDSEEIWALEHHYLYDKEFFLNRVTEDEKPKEIQEETKSEEPEVVQVDTMSEAKEFLNERFGVPRSSMKTLPQVLSTAYEHKVIFKGLTEDKEKDNNDKQ